MNGSNKEVTFPSQPAFLTQLAATRSNITGDGTTYTVVWGSEIFDQNNDFDNTSTFTAPVTGRYKFNFSLACVELTASHTDSFATTKTSNRSYLANQINIGAVRQSGNVYTMEQINECDMDLGDTAYIEVNVSNGTKVVDLLNDNGNNFSGYLMV